MSKHVETLPINAGVNDSPINTRPLLRASITSA